MTQPVIDIERRREDAPFRLRQPGKQQVHSSCSREPELPRTAFMSSQRALDPRLKHVGAIPGSISNLVRLSPACYHCRVAMRIARLNTGTVLSSWSNLALAGRVEVLRNYSDRARMEEMLDVATPGRRPTHGILHQHV